MSSFADDIITQGRCVARDGTPVPLHSHTGIEQCRFLVDLMRQTQPADSLEIGLAYGVSALYLAEEAARRGKTHIIIDPFQRDRVWQGLGLVNLERAGLMGSCRFIEEDARTELPRLADGGQRIGFAYIDASKRLDDMLIMFHFIFRMMPPGGIIVFDDVAWYPGISDALRYIVQMPGVEVCATHATVPQSVPRRTMQWLARGVPWGRRLFAAEWTQPAHELGFAGGCVALRKISEDVGDWGWHP